jgi:hypothetical protein
MTWLIFSLMSCVAVCGAIEITRRSRINGYEVTLYRCLISGFLLLPVIPYMSWPHDLKFYVMAGGTAFIYAWANIIMSNLAAKGGGRVAMMFQPLAIFLTYLVWLAIEPAQFAILQNQPQQLGLTAVCFGILLVSLHFIRRNDYAWSSLMAIAPVGIGFAFVNIAQKWFLDTPDGGLGMILAIMLIGNFGQVVALPLLGRFRVKTNELQIMHHARFPLFLIGAIALLHMVSWGALMHAMQIADNPAYPVAIMALCPVVFQMYYWVRGWRDNASPLAGAAMTLSAFALGLIHT